MRLYFFILSTILTANAACQSTSCDTIWFANGQQELVNIIKETGDQVSFSKCGDLTDHYYIVPVKEVKTLKRANGNLKQPKTAQRQWRKAIEKTNFSSMKKNYFFASIPVRPLYRLGYARAITGHLAFDIHYTYFNLQNAFHFESLFGDIDWNIEKSGQALRLSARYYPFTPTFNGFYFQPGYAGTQLRNVYIPNIKEPPYTKNIINYNASFGVGYSLKRPLFTFDFSAGLRGWTKRNMNLWDYYPGIYLVYCNIMVGVTL